MTTTPPPKQIRLRLDYIPDITSYSSSPASLPVYKRKPEEYIDYDEDLFDDLLPNFRGVPLEKIKAHLQQQEEKMGGVCAPLFREKRYCTSESYSSIPPSPSQRLSQSSYSSSSSSSSLNESILDERNEAELNEFRRLKNLESMSEEDGVCDGDTEDIEKAREMDLCLSIMNKDEILDLFGYCDPLKIESSNKANEGERRRKEFLRVVKRKMLLVEIMDESKKEYLFRYCAIKERRLVDYVSADEKIDPQHKKEVTNQLKLYNPKSQMCVVIYYPNSSQFSVYLLNKLSK